MMDDDTEMSVRQAIARTHAKKTAQSMDGWDQRDIIADIDLQVGVTDSRLELAIAHLDEQAETIKRIIVALIARSSLTAVEVAAIITDGMDATHREVILADLPRLPAASTGELNEPAPTCPTKPTVPLSTGSVVPIGRRGPARGRPGSG